MCEHAHLLNHCRWAIIDENSLKAVWQYQTTASVGPNNSTSRISHCPKEWSMSSCAAWDNGILFTLKNKNIENSVCSLISLDSHTHSIYTYISPIKCIHNLLCFTLFINPCIKTIIPFCLWHNLKYCVTWNYKSLFLLKHINIWLYHFLGRFRITHVWKCRDNP